MPEERTHPPLGSSTDLAARAVGLQELTEQLRNFFRRRAPSHADDLAQQTILKTLCALELYRADAPLRAFAFGIARRILMSHWRATFRRAHVTWDESEHDEIVEPASRGAEIELELALLPPELRDVIELVYLQGMTRRDAARALSLPQGTVSSRLRRSLHLLRERMHNLED